MLCSTSTCANVATVSAMHCNTYRRSCLALSAALQMCCGLLLSAHGNVMLFCSASAGSNNFERYRAWFNLPALLGLCLNSPTITTTAMILSEHSMANELQALVHAVKCLALAQQQAANKVLPCGSKFLHPEATNQAGGMLATFAKVAATTLYLRYVQLVLVVVGSGG